MLLIKDLNLLHDGLFFNGSSGDIIKILRESLRNRKRRVVLNNHCSSWADFSAVVPQGSILGPLLFVRYCSEK